MRQLALLLLFSLTLLTGGCSQAWPGQDGSFNFNIVFADAKGIAVGAPLVFRGVTIGDVTQVTLMTVPSAETDAPCQVDAAMLEQLSEPQIACVSIAVDAASRNQVRQDSAFLIRNSALVSFPEQKLIEMTVWNSSSPEMPAGATVIGQNNLLEFYLNKAQTLGEKLTLGRLIIRTELNDDGSVQRVYQLETNAYLPIEELLKSLTPAGEPGWEVTRSTEEETSLLRVTQVFPSAAGFRSQKSDFSLTANESTLGGDYIYTEDFRAGEFRGEQNLMSLTDWQTRINDLYNRFSGGQEDYLVLFLEALGVLLAQIQAGATAVLPLDQIDVVISIKMPGEIVTEGTNASFVNGNEASWLLTAEELNQGFPARAVARRGGLSFLGGGQSGASTPWIAGGIIAVFVLGFGGYVWYKATQRPVSYDEDDLLQDYSNY